MSVLTWLVAGCVAGWLVCVYLGTTHSHAFIFNIAVAAVGAAVGSWTLGSTFGVSPGFNSYGLIFGVFSGLLVVAAVQIVQRRIMS